MMEPGVSTTVTLTCQRCGAEASDESDDTSFNAEQAIAALDWTYGEQDMELICGECHDKEMEASA
jgi:hypothetical protein